MLPDFGFAQVVVCLFADNYGVHYGLVLEMDFQLAACQPATDSPSSVATRGFDGFIHHAASPIAGAREEVFVQTAHRVLA